MYWAAIRLAWPQLPADQGHWRDDDLLALLDGEVERRVAPVGGRVEGGTRGEEHPFLGRKLTEGKSYRFGSIRMPLDLWAPWRDSEQGEHGQPADHDDRGRGAHEG